MAEITPKMVMELRKATGLGMMDCKKALGETEGDIDAAIDLLRKKGLAKAAKKADRVANDGIIKIVKADKSHGCMLLVNCETDFVSRGDDFKAMVDGFADFFLTSEVPEQCIGAAASSEHIESQIKSMAYGDHTVGDELTQMIAKIGENMNIGGIVLERSDDTGDFLQEYKHGNRVGVMVCLTTGKPETHDAPAFQELAKDVAMQVAAAMPRVAVAVDREGVDAAEVEHEKKVLTDQAMEEGKPAEIAEKMVMGRINKFFSEVCLLEQPFIKDDKKQVKEIIKGVAEELGDTIIVARFHRFQLGE